MTDWTNCPSGGAKPQADQWILGICRNKSAVYARFENLESVATINQFLEWFPEVKEWRVAPVLKDETEPLCLLS